MIGYLHNKMFFTVMTYRGLPSDKKSLARFFNMLNGAIY